MQNKLSNYGDAGEHAKNRGENVLRDKGEARLIRHQQDHGLRSQRQPKN